MIYLDYNATAPMKPAVRAAVMEAMERTGNPSSVHRYGRVARRYVEDARARVAALVGVEASQVVLTGGGTEANNLACRQSAAAFYPSAIEHASVLNAATVAETLPVTQSGMLDLDRAEAVLAAAPASSLVAVMVANNETGIVQPIEAVAALTRRYGHRLHVDAVQAAGKLALDFDALGADSLALSAHKIGGPQGVGALVLRRGASCAPLLTGGGQEQNRRAGSHNVAGIVGFGVAAQLAVDDVREATRLAAWRDAMQSRLCAAGGDDAVVIGADAPRLANTLCIAMRGVDSATQVMALDLDGVAVSAGAACSSGKVAVSHVLRAMGYGDDVALCAVRISLGWATEEAHIRHGIEAWTKLSTRTRDRASASSQPYAA